MKPRPWVLARHFPQMTVRGWLGRNLDQGGGGGGDGTEGEPELRGLGAGGEPTANDREGGDGTEGEPELRELGAEGEPTARTMGGAVGEPPRF